MINFRFGRHALGVCVTIAMLAGCGGGAGNGVVPTGGAPDHFPSHKTFNYTGAAQQFTVPHGVESIDIVARGGAGGGIMYPNNRSGRGGRVHAVIPVTPGERLYVYVGGAGVEKSGRFTGGFNGGGDPGACCEAGFGGGGATDVRHRGQRLSDRILVAGGGGGQGAYECCGGAGGEGGATIGGAGGYFGPGGRGGDGGTQSRGGKGGSGGMGSGYGYGPGDTGKPGKLGVGGSGGLGGYAETSSSAGGSGGGAGGGYYGGGGGGGGGGDNGGGGGGGGSSYVEPKALKFHMWQGWNKATGDGLVVISWQYR